jgi:hypothetical protein
MIEKKEKKKKNIPVKVSPKRRLDIFEPIGIQTQRGTKPGKEEITEVLPETVPEDVPEDVTEDVPEQIEVPKKQKTTETVVKYTLIPTSKIVAIEQETAETITKYGYEKEKEQITETPGKVTGIIKTEISPTTGVQRLKILFDVNFNNSLSHGLNYQTFHRRMEEKELTEFATYESILLRTLHVKRTLVYQKYAMDKLVYISL